jgi:integral membrane sensor domain MASE1
MEEEDRGRVYGCFTALMACGSCFEAVAWAAMMMTLLNFFKGHTSADPFQEELQLALAYSWCLAFLLVYTIEFLCMCVVIFMCLRRSRMRALRRGGLQRGGL